VPIESLYEFGSDRNVVVILMDMLQGSFLEQALQRDPRLRETLQGFDIFTRGISPFPFTSYSLPSLLSGVPYASDARGFVPNWEAAMSNSFITDAERVGYSTVAVQSFLVLPPAKKNVQAASVPEDQTKSLTSFKGYVLGRHAVEQIY
jgi:hypothetical protein